MVHPSLLFLLDPMSPWALIVKVIPFLSESPSTTYHSQISLFLLQFTNEALSSLRQLEQKYRRSEYQKQYYEKATTHELHPLTSSD